MEALRIHKGNKTHAAESLNMARTTYNDRLARIQGGTAQQAALYLDKVINYQPKTTNLPESNYQVRHDPALRRVLFIPDTHIPFNDKRATNLMMKAAANFQPDVVVIMGDFADFYAVSSHDKDPKRKDRLADELILVNKELDRIDSLGASTKIYIEGNHEDRLRRYNQKMAPALVEFQPTTQSLLHLDERGYDFIPYMSHTRLGKLYLTHDSGRSGKYSTQQTLDDYAHSVATAHAHRMQMVVENDATGRALVGLQFGWLGDRSKVGYMKDIKSMRDWALGFGIGYIDDKDVVFAHPVPIVNYACVVGGQLYKG